MTRTINVITIHPARNYPDAELLRAVEIAAAIGRGDFWLCLTP